MSCHATRTRFHPLANTGRSVMNELLIDLPAGCGKEMGQLLDEAGIEWKDTTPKPPQGSIWASGSDLVTIFGLSIPLGIVAKVLIAWMKNRSDRKLTFTTKGNGIIQISSEGFSHDEVTKALADAYRVIADEAPREPDDPELT